MVLRAAAKADCISTRTECTARQKVSTPPSASISASTQPIDSTSLARSDTIGVSFKWNAAIGKNSRRNREPAPSPGHAPRE